MSHYRGEIETLEGRVLRGWVAAPAPEAEFLTVQFEADGHRLGSVLAQLDPDAPDARLRFEFLLPRLLTDGASFQLNASIGEQPVALARALVTLGVGLQQATLPTTPLVGFLERVTPEGRVEGWAWYPEQPHLRAELEFLADGLLIGAVTAELDRRDVAGAGIGDGRYGYSWPLPFTVLTGTRRLTISVRARGSEEILPAPVVFEHPVVGDALSRVTELEADLALLRASLASHNEAALREREENAGLFTLAGKFFTALAQAPDLAAAQRAVQPLAGAPERLLAQLPVFTLPTAEQPALSLCLLADAPAAVLHETLREAVAALAGLPVAFTLLDDGTEPEAALLPLAAQGLRFLRLPGAPLPALLNEAARLTPAPGLLILPGAGRLTDAQVAHLPGLLRGAPPALALAPWPGPFAFTQAAWSAHGGFDEALAPAASLAAFASLAAAAAPAEAD